MSIKPLPSDEQVCPKSFHNVRSPAIYLLKTTQLAMATVSANATGSITLYGFYRSSCSARLRIALLSKQLKFESVPVDLPGGLHLKDEYARFNPSRSVPTLVIAGHKAPITQSMAMLEYLEEMYPNSPALLPKDAIARAQVRALANIIACDVQPVTNMKVLKRVEALGEDRNKWARDFHADGFTAFEAIIKDTAGKYSVGDDITLADICLVPACWNAERFGLNLDKFPTIMRVYETLSSVSAFQEGHWRKQSDCPKDMR